MDSTALSEARLRPAHAATPALTPRDYAGMGVMVSGGLWMALIFTAIAPILSAMSKALGNGGDGYWIGQLTMTMPDIGIIVGGPLAGFLVDRIGSRMLLFISLALYAVAGSAGLFADDGTVMLSTRLILGFAGAGIATSTTALIGDRFDGQMRVRALGYWSAVGAAGGVGSVFVAGQVADLFGGWHGPFALYLLAVVPLAVGILALPARPRRIAGVPKAAASPPFIKLLWPLYLGMIPIYVAVFMTGVQLSFLLGADHIDSPVTQSWVIGAASAGSFLGAFVFGFVRPRIGPRGTLLLFIALMAAGNILMPLTADPVLMGLGGAMNGMGGGMANPYFAAILIERAPVAARGRAIGLLYTAMFFGEFMNPFVVTPLAHVLGIHGAFFAVAAILAAIGFTIALRSTTRQAKGVPA